jgi:exonuclease 1
MLLHFGVKPYLVFDGDNLPSKAGTEIERAARRTESKQRGLELLHRGRTSEAHHELQKAVDVTPEMAARFIEELRKAKIDYVVAPFEADAQLAYLEQKGLIHGIISEDSDLLVFGAKCLITKLDQYGGCVAIKRAEFTACRDISLVGWSDADFRKMAILSGCDYLSSMEKMGLKTAYRSLRKHKTVERVLRALQFDGKIKVPPGYLEAFIQAERTFLHHWVFCPLTKQMINLTELPADLNVEQLPFLGAKYENDVALKVALGEAHPTTKRPLNVYMPTFQGRRVLTPQRSTSMSTDGKGGRPIDSFFQPKRTPLAELDPNMFTPSPSQQQLLSQQPSTWAPRHASTPASAPSRTSSMPMPSATRAASTARQSSTNMSAPPRPSRRVASDITPQGSTPSTSNKRQRLCAEVDTDSQTPSRVENDTSRFFPPIDPSPSLRRRSNKKKVPVFSDRVDSSEEIVHSQERDDSQEKVDSQVTSQSSFLSSSIASYTSVESQSSSFIDTPATSTAPSRRASQVSPARSPSFDSGLAFDIKDLRSKFSFQPNTPGSSSRKPSKDSSSGRSQPSSSKRPANPSGDKKPSEDLGIEDKDFQELESRVVIPGSDPEIPSSPVRAQKVPAVGVRGSEDLLVPDSEDDEGTASG